MCHARQLVVSTHVCVGIARGKVIFKFFTFINIVIVIDKTKRISEFTCFLEIFPFHFRQPLSLKTIQRKLPTNFVPSDREEIPMSFSEICLPPVNEQWSQR